MPQEKRRHIVLVDTREPPVVKQAIQCLLPEEIELVALPEGDFALTDRDTCFLGIERKTVSDFLASLADGRLAAQIARMSKTFTTQGLIIEGEYVVTGDGYLRVTGHGSYNSGWRHTALQMTLWSLQRHYPDLVVWWSLNLGTTADIIRGLEARGYRGCFDDTSLVRGESPDPGESNGGIVSNNRHHGAAHGRSGAVRRDRVPGGRPHLAAP